MTTEAESVGNRGDECRGARGDAPQGQGRPAPCGGRTQIRAAAPGAGGVWGQVWEGD